MVEEGREGRGWVDCGEGNMRGKEKGVGAHIKGE